MRFTVLNTSTNTERILCQFSSVQSLSRVRLFVTPWFAAHQASLCITNSQSLLKLMSIELVMPSNHLILCSPLLLLSSVFPSIRVFSNELVLHSRWTKYWSFSISPSNEYSGLISFKIDWFGLLIVQRLPRIFSTPLCLLVFLFLWDGFGQCLLYSVTNFCL